MICPLNRGTGMDYKLRLYITHDGNRLMTAAIRHDLAYTYLHVICTFMMVTHHPVGGQQITALFGAFPVVERLIIGKRHGCIQNVDNPGHVFVYKTGQFVVTHGWKHYGERLWASGRRRAYARGAVITYPTDRIPGATYRKWQTNMPRGKKGDGVDFVHCECPSDTVSDVDPDFIW